MGQRIDRRRILLGLECTGLFLLLPILLAAVLGTFNPIPLLLAIAPAAAWYLYRHRGFSKKAFGNLSRIRRCWPRFLLVCLLIIVGLTGLLLVSAPHLLFDLPRHSLALWFGVLLFYSLVAVYPQELIYRAFFFQRYRSLFANDSLLLAASSLAFACGHVIYGNLVAVLLAVAGGLLFGFTYSQSRSIAVAAIEHALYGSLLYTLGLGQFISSSTH